MGTEIINDGRSYIKRFYGGKDKGMMFYVKIDGEFTPEELKELYKVIKKAMK